MKKIFIWIGAISIIFLFLIIIIGNAPASQSDAIRFGKERIEEIMKDPDSTTFRDVRFHADSESTAERLSGFVCGYVNSKNSFGAYVGETGFVIKVVVYNKGKSANLGIPAFLNSDNQTESGAAKLIWTENCK